MGNKLSRLKVLFVAIVCVLSLLPTTRAAAFQFKHITMQEGLSQLSVLSIYQDKLGRMWFGTEEGLNVYDGNNVVAIKQFRGLSPANLEVTSITGDDEGNIYFIVASTIVRCDYRTQTYKQLVGGTVTALQYHDKCLWYAQKGQLYAYDTNAKATKKVLTLPNSRINAIIFDPQGRLLLGANTGLYSTTANNAKPKRILQAKNIEYIFCDSRRNVWAASHDNGLYRTSPEGQTTHFKEAPGAASGSSLNFSDTETRVQQNISSNLVRGIAEDTDGNIWIGTFLGLNMYDPHTGRFTVYSHTYNPGSISHSSVFPIVRDRFGTMWLGTYFGGVNYFNPRNDTFTYYAPDVNREKCLSYPFVGHITADSHGNIWICTEGGGLNRMNLASGIITHYTMNPGGNSIAQNNLKCIAYDKADDRLYIGTHLGGLSVLDIATQRFTNVYRLHPEYNQKFGNKILDLKLWHGKLIVASSIGVWLMDTRTYAMEPLLPGVHISGFIYLHIDRNDNLWIAADNVLMRASLPSRRLLATYRCGQKGLAMSQLNRIAEDRRGQIYVTSSGNGIYKYDRTTDTFRGFTTANSHIPSDFCYDIICHGRMLVFNTDRGLGFLNTDNGEFRSIGFSNEFPLTGIHNGCGLYSVGDLVFAGGTNGMVSFHASKLFETRDDEHLYISRITVNNRDCSPGDDIGAIDRAAYLNPDVHLNHDQSNLVVWFGTDKYTDDGSRAVYEYRLRGYDNDWTSTSHKRIAYSKLPPGRYTLEIRLKAEPWLEGKSPTVRTLRMHIRVSPPFYLSGLAYTLYILAALAIVAAIYYIKRKQLLLETSLAIEKKDKQNIEALNKAKLQFFTSISHEFRTPLTLIIAKLDSLLGTLQKNTAVYQSLKSINANASQMLELVGELMDFRKMEQGHTQLHVARHDIVEFTRGIASDFDELAAKRGVQYTFTASAPHIECWFDRTQMQKVIYNLVSNAFKYVKEEQGAIEVRVDETDSGVTLRVIDNGVGIDKKDIAHIFDRFYQAGNTLGNAASSRGTGIGLALVKTIVERHHGHVSVLSSAGCGSIFIVELLKGRSHFADNELCSVDSREERRGDAADKHPGSHDDTTAETDTDTNEPTPADGQPLPKILVVEDNAELLDTLTRLFCPLFSVVVAHDGAEGCDVARRENPDIIVSDIMMPVKSGIEMCKTLKNDISTSHIPILLLTAMGAAEQEVEGLRCGADDYMAKPFNPKVLIARCQVLLRIRRMLRAKFADEEISMAEAKPFATNQLDRQFIDQCDRIISEHLLDSDFTVDHIAKAMSMSRTSFFEKFKAITGMTPNEYMVTQRLTRAAKQLRENPQITVADVAYALGFSTPRYFSQCFKKRYGASPTEWREKNSDTPQD